MHQTWHSVNFPSASALFLECFLLVNVLGCVVCILSSSSCMFLNRVCVVRNTCGQFWNSFDEKQCNTRNLGTWCDPHLRTFRLVSLLSEWTWLLSTLLFSFFLTPQKKIQKKRTKRKKGKCRDWQNVEGGIAVLLPDSTPECYLHWNLMTIIRATNLSDLNARSKLATKLTMANSCLMQHFRSYGVWFYLGFSRLVL